MAHSAAWTFFAALCALPIYAFWSPAIGLPVMVTLGALGLLAFYRTADALLLLAAIGPIAATVHGLLQTPYDGHRLFEAAILVVCGAAALRAAIGGSALKLTAFEWLAVAFAVVALTSWLAQMPMTLLRMGASGVPAGVDLLSREFFANRAPPAAPLWQTAVLLEGVALAVLTARVAKTPDTVRRLLRMSVVGGAAAAALNVHRLLEVSLRNPPFAEGLLRALKTLRFNTQYGDLNAAGSYFALVAILCSAAVMEPGVKSWRGWVYSFFLALIGCALWISGSRIALIAAALCTGGLILKRWRPSLLGAARWHSAALAAVGMVLLVLAGLFFFPSYRHGTFGYSVFTRIELVEAGARMWADRPFIGVGTSRFYEQLPQYASPELFAAFLDATGVPIRHENAHNQFVQILAELGIVGFTAFVAMLGFALVPAGKQEFWSRGAAMVAVGGFLFTCLAGHPLLTPMVAYSFWLVVGVVASGAPAVTSRVSRYLRYAAMTVGFLMMATLPLRWNFERKTADLTGVSLGLSGWERDTAGMRFRWSGKRSTFFVTARAVLLRLPLRSSASSPQRVEILLDGRPAAGVWVLPEMWIEATLLLTPSASGPAFRRIDLSVRGENGETSETTSRVLMVGHPHEVMHEEDGGKKAMPPQGTTRP